MAKIAEIPAEAKPAQAEKMEQQQEHQPHECTIAVYTNKDMSKQSKTYHSLTRLNQEFYKCSVYDSGDTSVARLIGVEFIISERIYHVLPQDEKKHWHSHAYEVKDNLWLNLQIIEVFQKTEIKNLSKSYGKFWYTWEWDNGELLPLGVPSLKKSLADPVDGGPRKDGKSNGRRERFITYVRRIKRSRITS